jgi:hypothetical protein
MRDIYPKTKFTGTLEDQRGKSLNIEFYATIDRAAELPHPDGACSEDGAAFEFLAHNVRETPNAQPATDRN